MDKLTKLLLLIVIFLAGCSDGHTNNLIKKESRVKAFLMQEINQNNYSIKRASNGVYIYTDRPKSTQINNYLNINEQIINN